MMPFTMVLPPTKVSADERVVTGFGSCAWIRSRFSWSESDLTLQLCADELRPLDHRLHLAEGDFARKVFEAAIGRDDDALRFDIG